MEPRHASTALQVTQRNELTTLGQSYYDDLRLNRQYTHNDALRAARYSYGVRRD